MLLHVPAPLVALLSVFVVLGLLSRRETLCAGSRRSALLVCAWTVVGLASAAVWTLWWRLPAGESPEPAYLSVLGHCTTALAVVVVGLTVGHRAAARSGPSRGA